MKLTQNHMDSLVRHVLFNLRDRGWISFNKSEAEVLEQGKEIINRDCLRESDLDAEVVRMLDEMEKNQKGPFERHSLFKKLKARLAEERNIVL